MYYILYIYVYTFLFFVKRDEPFRNFPSSYKMLCINKPLILSYMYYMNNGYRFNNILTVSLILDDSRDNIVHININIYFN